LRGLADPEMGVLIISDEIEKSSFHQIHLLKEEIQALGEKVDLVTLTRNTICLNEKEISKDLTLMTFLEQRLLEKKYPIIAVSLVLKNFKRLFSDSNNIVDIVEKLSSETEIFIFGGYSLLKEMEKDKSDNLFLYQRPGVSKVTKQFKQDLVNHIRKRQTFL
jgi:quinolinate synthase